MTKIKVASFIVDFCRAPRYIITVVYSSDEVSFLRNFRLSWYTRILSQVPAFNCLRGVPCLVLVVCLYRLY